MASNPRPIIPVYIVENNVYKIDFSVSPKRRTRRVHHALTYGKLPQTKAVKWVGGRVRLFDFRHPPIYVSQRRRQKTPHPKHLSSKRPTETHRSPKAAKQDAVGLQTAELKLTRKEKAVALPAAVAKPTLRSSVRVVQAEPQKETSVHHAGIGVSSVCAKGSTSRKTMQKAKVNGKERTSAAPNRRGHQRRL